MESFDFHPWWPNMRSFMDSNESKVSLVSDDSFEIMKILQVQGMELEVTAPVHARLP